MHEAYKSARTIFHHIRASAPATSIDRGEERCYLFDIPIEIRLIIFEYLLAEGPIYFPYLPAECQLTAEGPARSGNFHQHSMLLVNKQFSQEYADAVCKLTAFFFLIDERNMHRQPFWRLSDLLQIRQRRCKIYVEVDDPGNMLDLADRVGKLIQGMPRLEKLHLVWGMNGLGTMQEAIFGQLRDTAKALPALHSLNLSVSHAYEVRRYRRLERRFKMLEGRFEKLEGVWKEAGCKLPY